MNGTVKLTDCDAYAFTYNLEDELEFIDYKLVEIDNNLEGSDF